MNLTITAGYDGSFAAISLCELLQRSGHKINAVIVVSPFTIHRFRKLLTQQGYHGITKAINKLFNVGQNIDSNNQQDLFLNKYSINERSLKKWCNKNGVNYIVVDNINSQKSINTLIKNKPDAVIYSGGGILRKSFLNAARYKVINMHSGPLPEIRGMNSMEWAILLGYRTDITIHMIDEGIDTGEIISSNSISLLSGDNIETIRQKSVIAGIEKLIQLLTGINNLDELKRYNNFEANKSRQCYIMAPAIKELLEEKLKNL
jgi:methionyl-tRNA formyltransferase